MEEKKITVIEKTVQTPKKIRVGAYCRVSSSSSDQLHSFSAQVQYYTGIIRENPAMELVDIYADEGITGTRADKRDEFNRMIADCRKGKIDRIITKSLSRFARNTVDVLQYTRLLGEYGVSVLFEKENIDTAYLSNELLLALSGAQAQEESVSLSKNVRWSIEKRMQDGTYRSSSAPYGYRIENGEYVIVEQEAETVRWIFRSYLEGKGKKEIADILQKAEIIRNSPSNLWRINTIDYILKNERYIGDALFQKFYTTETLPFVHRKNDGVKAQYYVEDVNPPIITRKEFEAVQRRISDEKAGERNSNGDCALTGKILCSCGQRYKLSVIRGKRYWVCNSHHLDKELCRAKSIAEKNICNAFITMINKLRYIRNPVLTTAIQQTERLNMKCNGTAEKVRTIEKTISELSNKCLVLARLNSKGIIRASEYAEKNGKLTDQLSRLRAEKRKLLQEQDDNQMLSGLQKIDGILSEFKEPLTEFDENLFADTVTQITVTSDTEICFELYGGLKFTEYISR